MPRTRLIAANWKMHQPPVGAFVQDSPFHSVPGVDVWIFPSFLDLHSAQGHGLIVGAQCGRAEESGAFTGDISMRMLACQHYHAVLCGHSERRARHAETDAVVAAQAKAAQDAGLMPIVCVGESAHERGQGKAEEVVARQLRDITFPTTIAYEPVWAIGTGEAASPTDAQKMHAYIRSVLPPKEQERTRILYGGSVNATNAASLLRQADIDGFLVGGASLDPVAFRAIVEAAKS